VQVGVEARAAHRFTVVPPAHQVKVLALWGCNTAGVIQKVSAWCLEAARLYDVDVSNAG
jgi:hypothetical protein